MKAKGAKYFVASKAWGELTRQMPRTAWMVHLSIIQDLEPNIYTISLTLEYRKIIAEKILQNTKRVVSDAAICNAIRILIGVDFISKVNGRLYLVNRKYVKKSSGSKVT